MDPLGNIVHWNAGAERIMGFAASEVLGRELNNIFTEEDCNAGIPRLELEAAERMGRAADERWHVRKDGSRFWGLGAVTAIRGPDGALLGYGKIVADRTDLKTLQDTLQSRNDDLARADELKNRFLATLAHELRNPQAVLANSAGVLRRHGASDGKLQAIADMIERQVRQTQRLIEDLSDLVRSSRGRIELRMQPLDLREMARLAADAVQSAVTERRHELVIVLPDVPVLIEGDADRIQQVMINLLRNAGALHAAGRPHFAVSSGRRPGRCRAHPRHRRRYTARSARGDLRAVHAGSSRQRRVARRHGHRARARPRARRAPRRHDPGAQRRRRQGQRVHRATAAVPHCADRTRTATSCAQSRRRAPVNIRTYRNIAPVLGARVYVDPAAVVIGRVTIGDDSSIWPTAVVRGDVHSIEIGARTSIQDGSVLHVTHDGPYAPGGRSLTSAPTSRSAIASRCTPARSATSCLVGMGSIVLDNVVTEEFVMIGAGSVVPPGKRLETRGLYVGSPARRVRDLTQAEIEFFTYSAAHYVQGQERVPASFPRKRRFARRRLSLPR